MATPRAQIVDPNKKGLYHCFSRCVRRAFLMGPEHDHRRAWIERRLELLCSIFAADDAAHSAMSNHLHVLVRLDPPRAKQWSPEEVASRWYRLHPRSVIAQSGLTVKRGARLPEVIPEDVLEAVVDQPELIRMWRKRLASLSWFMKSLKEPLARMANAEDGVTGAFFEERFRSPRVLDLAGLLTCMVYIDLNPVRAEIAEGLVDSAYTSVRLRLLALKRFAKSKVLRETLGEEEMAKLQKVIDEESVDGEENAESVEKTWLAPIGGKGKGAKAPLLGMDAARYISIVETAGRAPAPGKKGRIPRHVKSVLESLSIDIEKWMALVREDRTFIGTAIGSKISLATEAVRRGMQRVVGAMDVFAAT